MYLLIPYKHLLGTSPAEQIIFSEIKRRINELTCNPKLEDLVTSTMISKSTIIKGIKNLEAKRFIKIDKEQNKNNIYSILDKGKVINPLNYFFPNIKMDMEIVHNKTLTSTEKIIIAFLNDEKNMLLTKTELSKKIGIPIRTIQAALHKKSILNEKSILNIFIKHIKNGILNSQLTDSNPPHLIHARSK